VMKPLWRLKPKHTVPEVHARVLRAPHGKPWPLPAVGLLPVCEWAVNRPRSDLPACFNLVAPLPGGRLRQQPQSYFVLHGGGSLNLSGLEWVVGLRGMSMGDEARAEIDTTCQDIPVVGNNREEC